MIRVTRQIKCLKAQAPALVSYLFIKQDQMILTRNSAVASLMLSQIF
jgi:hypothetical protein